MFAPRDEWCRLRGRFKRGPRADALCDLWRFAHAHGCCARAFHSDLPDAEVHVLDGGRFLLESAQDEVTALIVHFFARRTPTADLEERAKRGASTVRAAVNEGCFGGTLCHQVLIRDHAAVRMRDAPMSGGRTVAVLERAVDDAAFFDVYAATCPSRRLLNLVTSRWAVLIVGVLESGPTRFGELRRRLEGVSQKVLTEKLRDLEAEGIVTREVEPRPLAVVYALSPVGLSLVEPLVALRKWAQAHCDERADDSAGCVAEHDESSD